MSAGRTGAKGFELEETLRAYFWQAGYFVVRGAPYRIEADEITDIDLWLYERPAGITRRRHIVDVKNRRSPKASERVIWAKGLQLALGVDGAFVGTTDGRSSTKRLAKQLNVTLIDGEAVRKLSNSNSIKNVDLIHADRFEGALKNIDDARHGGTWRFQFRRALASIINGFGVSSANMNLSAAGYFAEQAVLAEKNSVQAELASRAVYVASAIAAVSLDYLLTDLAFKSADDRLKAIADGIRFGSVDGQARMSTVRAAIGLAHKYADNGNAVAGQIELGFFGDADRIPAEIVAEYVAKTSISENLFQIGRDLCGAGYHPRFIAFDGLGRDAKALLGVLLDFNGISREKFANSVQIPNRRENSVAVIGSTPSLFHEDGDASDPTGDGT